MNSTYNIVLIGTFCTKNVPSPRNILIEWYLFIKLVGLTFFQIDKNLFLEYFKEWGELLEVFVAEANFQKS